MCAGVGIDPDFGRISLDMAGECRYQARTQSEALGSIPRVARLGNRTIPRVEPHIPVRSERARRGSAPTGIVLRRGLADSYGEWPVSLEAGPFGDDTSVADAAYFPLGIRGTALGDTRTARAVHRFGIRGGMARREPAIANVGSVVGRRSSGRIPMVTRIAEPEIGQVWKDYRADPRVDLRNRLLENYLHLVKYNAERIWARLPDGVDLDDLISAGTFGLLDAVDAFDLERGVKFETYCVPRIRGAMLDELRTMDWVPRLVRSKQSKVSAAMKALEAALGRPPTREELCEKMGVPMEQIEALVTEASAVNLVSLNKKWYETDSYKDVREIDVLEDKKSEDPTNRLQNRDLMRLVTRGLNRNERLIVILYYYEEMTMKEIGVTLNLSQMHSSIVARLQSQLAKRRPEFSN